MLDGILIIDKPAGITSHDVVAKVRRALKTKRVGHTGTLDPLATGVLVVCVEKATKLVNYLTCDEKTYEVEMKFGIKTDTGDITGKIIDEDTNYDIDMNKIKRTLDKFIGKQEQIPPMYSAIKVNGKKLYSYAREGIKIEIEPRSIEIYNIELMNINKEEKQISFRVSCSKGTYIRSLCEDIAEKLGTVGYMKDLKRTKVGDFEIKEAITIEELKEKFEKNNFSDMITIENIFKDMPEIELNENNIKQYLNGVKIVERNQDGIYRIYYKNEFNGIGIVKDNKLKRDLVIVE